MPQNNMLTDNIAGDTNQRGTTCCGVVAVDVELNEVVSISAKHCLHLPRLTVTRRNILRVQPTRDIGSASVIRL